MSNDGSTSDEKSEIRYNLVNTAVNFLLNPAVINKPETQKTAFLKKKGLTDAEISLSFEKAESDPKYIDQKGTVQNSSVLPPPVPVYQRPAPLWSRVRGITSSLVVLGAAVFGAHYVYKNYIKPFIFGGDSKDDAVNEIEMHIEQTTKLLMKLESKLSSLEERVEGQNSQMDRFIHNENNDCYATPLALRELKTEIASVKSLLLNRHQFPALPKVASPSIPEWQLPKEDDSRPKEDDSRPKEDDSQPKESGEIGLHKDSSSSDTTTSSEDGFVRVKSTSKSKTLNNEETATVLSEQPAT